MIQLLQPQWTDMEFHLGALLIAYAKYFGIKSVSMSPD